MNGTAGASVAIVALPAEIDLTNCVEAATGLCVAIDNAGMVIADMTGTVFCDSSGVLMLLTVHDRAVAGGSELRLAIPPGGPVARVLAIIGVDRLLHIYASVADAVPAEPAAVQPTP